MGGPSSRLVTAKLKTLRPTQIGLGFAAVQTLVEKFKALPRGERAPYLSDHLFPAVKGPGGHYYITDRHHMAVSLIHCGAKDVRVVVQGDFSGLRVQTFWMAMDLNNWVHAYDEKGRRAKYSRIPTNLEHMVDDPYRSLSDAVQNHGGFAQTDMGYEEFLWADFFRTRLSLKNKNPRDPDIVMKAVSLARLPEAEYLPGWIKQPTL